MTRKQNGRKGIEFNRRKFLKTATVAGVGVGGLTAISGGAAAHPPGCDVLVDPSDPHADASTISGGVSAASAGDTVCVNDGTYTEQVVINKDLTLTSSPGDDPTIEAPSSPGQFTIPESDNDWLPVVFAFGGSESGGDVSGSGTVDVNITGLTVDGRDINTDSALPVDVLLRNVRPTGSNEKGSISDNTVTRGFIQPRTFGIVVEGDSALKIRGNDVDEYSRVGIFADGDEGPGPDPEVDIRGNTVTGPGQRDPDGEITWAPNGIQVSSGATGKIVDNTVDKNWFVASGIIVVDSNDISIKRNSLSENENGIVFAKFFEDSPVRNSTIQDNDLFGGDNLAFETGKMDNGVLLIDSDNSKVIKNNFDTWADGVDIASGDNNKVVNNSFTNVDEELDDGGDNTKNPPNPANP